MSLFHPGLLVTPIPDLHYAIIMAQLRCTGIMRNDVGSNPGFIASSHCLLPAEIRHRARTCGGREERGRHSSSCCRYARCVFLFTHVCICKRTRACTCRRILRARMAGSARLQHVRMCECVHYQCTNVAANNQQSTLCLLCIAAIQKAKPNVKANTFYRVTVKVLLCTLLFHFFSPFFLQGLSEGTTFNSCTLSLLSFLFTGSQ